MKEEKKNKKRKGPCYTSLIVFHTIPLFLISPLVSHSLSLCSFSLSHHRNCLSLSLRNNTTTTVSVHLYFGSFVGGWAITAPLEQPSPWLSTHSSHLLFYFFPFSFSIMAVCIGYADWCLGQLWWYMLHSWFQTLSKFWFFFFFEI